jgi:hypothetical protein
MGAAELGQKTASPFFHLKAQCLAAQKGRLFGAGHGFGELKFVQGVPV